MFTYSHYEVLVLRSVLNCTVGRHHTVIMIYIDYNILRMRGTMKQTVLIMWLK